MHPALLHRHTRSTVALIAAVLGAACSDGSGPVRPPICAAPVTVTASQAANPRITWTPDCRINGLSIVTANPNTVPVSYWLLSSPVDENPLEQPIVYGQIPAGATSFGTLGAFPQGDSVRIRLYISDSAQPDTLVEVGTVVVIPVP